MSAHVLVANNEGQNRVCQLCKTPERFYNQWRPCCLNDIKMREELKCQDHVIIPLETSMEQKCDGNDLMCCRTSREIKFFAGFEFCKKSYEGQILLGLLPPFDPKHKCKQDILCQVTESKSVDDVYFINETRRMCLGCVTRPYVNKFTKETEYNGVIHHLHGFEFVSF